MVDLNCRRTCPFVIDSESEDRPCTEKVAHRTGFCSDNIASNFLNEVRVQPIKDDGGENRTEVLEGAKRIATVKNGRITLVGAQPTRSG